MSTLRAEECMELEVLDEKQNKKIRYVTGYYQTMLNISRTVCAALIYFDKESEGKF